MRLFDQHPNVLVIPQVGYLPFHLAKLYNSKNKIDWEIAYHYIMDKTDVKFIFSEINNDIANEFIRLGDSPNFPINRQLSRKVFREMLSKIGKVTKKELIVSLHTAYAIGLNRDISEVKYLLMNDQPLHYKMNLKSSIKSNYNNDETYRKAKFIHLVRDPRASFASLRQQLIRQWNGMYQFSLKGLIKALTGLFIGKTNWCLFIHILDYTTSGSRELYKWRKISNNFFVIRNEDINLDFIPTMSNLTHTLGIDFYEKWRQPDYAPTSGGEIWKGVGAYNNTYLRMTQDKQKGIVNDVKIDDKTQYRFKIDQILRNDKKEISESITGPNRYVTERWKTRLTKHEIAFLEIIYWHDLADYNYETIYVNNNVFSKIRHFFHIIYPLSGELFSISWLKYRIKNNGILGPIKIIIEYISLIFFYIYSRLTLILLLLFGRLRLR